MATDSSSTPQTLHASGKHPRSKDDPGQVGKKMKGTCVSAVCDEVIKEPTKNKKGDEAIYCEGNCEAWLHHICAGISSPNFAELQNNDEFSSALIASLTLIKLNRKHLNSLFTLYQWP